MIFPVYIGAWDGVAPTPVIPTITALGSWGTETELYANAGAVGVITAELDKGKYLVRAGADGSANYIFYGLEYNGSSFTESSSALNDGTTNRSSFLMPVSTNLAFGIDGSGGWGLYQYTGGTSAVTLVDSGTVTLTYAIDVGQGGIVPLYESATDVWVCILWGSNSVSEYPTYVAIEVDFSTPATTTVTELDVYRFTSATYTGTSNGRLSVFGKVSNDYFMAGWYTNRLGNTGRGYLYYISLSFNTTTETFTLEKGETTFKSTDEYWNGAIGARNEVAHGINGYFSTNIGMKVNSESTLECVLMWARGPSGTASNTSTEFFYLSMASGTGTITEHDNDSYALNTRSGLILYKNGASISDAQFVWQGQDNDASGSTRYESYMGYVDFDTSLQTVAATINTSWGNVDGVTDFATDSNQSFFTYDFDKLVGVFKDTVDSNKAKYNVTTITNS